MTFACVITAGAQVAQWPSALVLRDSLDAVTMPVPVYERHKAEVTIIVKNQDQWDRACAQIEQCLRQGKRNIKVQVSAKTLELGRATTGLDNLNYPDANIQIVARKTLMLPQGVLMSRADAHMDEGASHYYALPYKGFTKNDVLLDADNHLLSMREDVFFVDTRIEEVKSEGTIEIMNPDGSLYKTITKTWRIKTHLPDLDEATCRHFYLLLTRLWTSCRHQVIKVKDGYLYFHLKSDDAPTPVQMTLDPNSDMQRYHIPMRCQYINSPVGNGIHTRGDSIYIPQQIEKLRIGKGGRLFTITNCKFNSLEISGFIIAGAAFSACIYARSSTFGDHLWIRDNRFSNLSFSAVSIVNCKNVCVCDNDIANTRVNAIYCDCENLSIWGNHLQNIGTMAQTMAIAFAGKNVHVFENTIEDFNYAAISTGGIAPVEKNYIVEHNVIKYSSPYHEKYKEKTLMDGGGIYIGPQNTQGLIRYNVIENIAGIHINRGIYLDDGAKNLSIYGNMVLNTANFYDIDLRYCSTYSKTIPDHNTNNAIFYNFMSGNYRFEEKNPQSTCIGGANVFLGNDDKRHNVISITNYADDIYLSQCQIRNHKVYVPNEYRQTLDAIYTDGFIRKKIVYTSH